MKQPIRIMFYADAYNATSGYSRVAYELATRLAKGSNFDVYFQESTSDKPIHQENGVTILPCFFPRDHKGYLNVILNHISTFGPHVFIPISDPFLMVRDGLHKILFNDIKLLTYSFLDSNTMPDTSELILDKSDKILSATEHSKKILTEEGYSSDTLYVGVNFDSFKSVDRKTKLDIRKEIDLPEDKKIFLFIGRNFLRKRSFRLIESIATYNKNNPNNNAHFLLHMTDTTNSAWNIEKFIRRTAKRFNVSMNNIEFTNNHTLGNGLSESELVKLFQASDFYITASSGEGFGMPIIEAMACKKVVIAPDNTTHSIFLADNRGILVNNIATVHSGLGTIQDIVDIDDMASKINLAMNIKIEEYNAITDKAYEWVKDKCNWDKITNQLKSYILQLKPINMR